MSTRLWIVTEYYYPIVTSTGYYMTEIAEYLAAKGIDVNVITTGSRYNETAKYDIATFEEHNGVKINRVLVKEIDKNNFIKRTIRLFYTSCKLLKEIVTRVKKNDELLVVTNPAFILMAMPYVSKLKKVPYTLVAHDIFPENLVAINKLSSSSVVYKLLKHFFDTSYARALRCISIGRDMSNVINAKTNGTVPIELIPNWSDNDKVFPQKKEDTRLYRELNTGDFIFQFAGNIGHAQGIENILAAIELINEPAISFLFIGGGAKLPMVEAFAKTHSNVIALGFRDRREQNDFLNMCDVAIVTLTDGMYGLGVPSKSYNIMATGKPILYIGDATSEIAMCIKEYGIGWIVEPNNPQALAETVLKIYNDRDSIGSLASKSRDLADGIFAKNNILERYYNLYNH